MLANFKTIIVVLLTLILVYVMMSREIKDPELLDWSIIGRLNLESMTNTMKADPITLVKKNGGYAVWDKSQHCVIKNNNFIDKIEARDTNWMIEKPWIYVFCSKKVDNSIKISDEEYVVIFSSVKELGAFMKKNNISIRKK